MVLAQSLVWGKRSQTRFVSSAARLGPEVVVAQTEPQAQPDSIYDMKRLGRRRGRIVGRPAACAGRICSPSGLPATVQRKRVDEQYFMRLTTQ